MKSKSIIPLIIMPLVLVASILVYVKAIAAKPEDAGNGLRVLTDANTGCQYLAHVNGGITPRIDLAGRNHMGCGILY